MFLKKKGKEISPEEMPESWEDILKLMDWKTRQGMKLISRVKPDIVQLIECRIKLLKSRALEFKQKHGREPTEEELKKLLKSYDSLP